MSYRPLISLIMPTYNHEKFIKKSISSILNQTYSFLELIIIDDGSTDNTSMIINEFNDNRINYFYQKNKGVNKLNETINKGLSKSKGTLVTMLTSDDYIPHDRFANQVNFFKNENIDLVFGNITLVDEKDNIIKLIKPSIDKNYNSLSKKLKIKKYFENNYIPQPSTLIRMSALKKIGGYLQEDYMYAEDYPTQLNLMINGDVRYINKNFSFYRLHDSQMTRLHQDKMIESDNRYLIEFYKKLPDKKKFITGFENLSALNNYLENKFLNLSFYIAISKACINQKEIAEKFFTKGYRYGMFKEKIKCFIGLLLLKINFNFNILRKIKIFYQIKFYGISNYLFRK